MKRSFALLFPGQGAQYVGMGKSFFETYSVARETLEQAEDILGYKLSKIILEGPEEKLKETRYSQVAIYVVTIALLRVIKSLWNRLQPSVYAGLSLGEYSALTAAGWLSFEQGLPLVQQRADFMNQACEKLPGGMAVILGLEAEKVEALVKKAALPKELWVANYNCPGQIVVSGTLYGIDVVTQLAKEQGVRRILPLSVHGAFHSGLMQSAQDNLEPFIRSTSFALQGAPVVMNVCGDFVETSEKIPDFLIQQITQPVRWEQGVRRMIDKGITHFIEIGCGKTLTGFTKRTAPLVQAISVEEIRDLETLEHLNT